MTTKKLPLYLENTFESIYGNFGARLGAVFLDWFFLSPVIIAMAIYNSMHLNNYYFSFIIYLLVVIVYFTYLPVRYGATPAKRLLGMTILKIDGSTISYRESFLKILPQLVLSLLSYGLQCYLISLADEDTFNHLPWLKQAKYINSFFPYSTLIIMIVGNAYNIANLTVFLMNERKRSIGDQLAGTVVVYTRFLEKIKELEITN